jgi:hypothetical protein
MIGKLFIILILCLEPEQIIAQQVLYDGIVEYAVRASNKSAEKKIFYGDEIGLTLYLKGGQSRLDIRSQAGSESSIFDTRNGQGFVLRNYSDQKLIMHANAAQWAEWLSPVRKLEFEVIDSNHMIGGYSCNIAVANDSGAVPVVFKVYYEPLIKISNRSHFLAPGNIESLVVKMEVSYPESDFTYELKSLNFELPSSIIFEIPRKGYRAVKWENAIQQGLK